MYEYGYYEVNGAPREYGAGHYPAQIAGYYDIGADPVAAAAAHPAVQQAVAQAISKASQQITMQRPARQPSSHLKEKMPTTDRVLWLGFKFAGIVAAANQSVSSQPQDTFSPRKVVIPGSVAPNFEIADLKIGAISQFSSSDPIPAEAFIPNAQLTDVHFDTAQISQSVTFSVNNISNATATFRASMNGFVVRL